MSHFSTIMALHSTDLAADAARAEPVTGQAEKRKSDGAEQRQRRLTGIETRMLHDHRHIR
jgi:hypothetical protein